MDWLKLRNPLLDTPVFITLVMSARHILGNAVGLLVFSFNAMRQSRS